MPKPARPRKPRTKTNKPSSSRHRPTRPAEAPKDVAVARDRFTADVLSRGEAVERGADGKVPRHATHVVTRDAAGKAVVKRVRFKTF